MTCEICNVKLNRKNSGTMEGLFGRTVLTPAEQVRFDKVKKPPTVCIDCKKDLLMAQLVSIAE